jgi:hypothetical protein
MSNWQPAHMIDVVLRFNVDLGPIMRSAVEAALNASFAAEDKAREVCRALARGVGEATHAYVWAAPDIALTHVRLPSNADDDGTTIALRLRLAVPMTQPIDYSNGTAVAGFLQSLMALPRGSLVGVDVTWPAPARAGEPSPLLTTLNPTTLPGQKLCAYCRNPMPDYEVQCASCGARADR